MGEVVTLKVDQGCASILRRAVKGELEADSDSRVDTESRYGLDETLSTLKRHGELLDQLGWDLSAAVPEEGVEIVGDRDYLNAMIQSALYDLGDRVSTATGNGAAPTDPPDPGELAQLGDTLGGLARLLREVQPEAVAV